MLAALGGEWECLAVRGRGSSAWAGGPGRPRERASERSQRGAGAFLAGRVSPLAALATGLVLLAAATAGVHGLELAACAVATVVAAGLLFARWLGGVTGDTLGATAEVAETLALVTAAALTG